MRHLSWAIVAVSACSPLTTPPSPVILISADTLRADRLNSYGYDRRTLTPELDRLAGDGILFEQHVTASPWTTPAHMSLLTSLSPSSHGVTDAVAKLEAALRDHGEYPMLGPSATTLSEVLQRNGYVTGAFTGGGTMDPMFGFGRGFDLYEVNLPKLSRRRMQEVLDWIDTRAGRPFFLFFHTFEVHAPYLHADFVGEVLEPEQARRVQRAVRRLANSRDEGAFALPRLLARHEATGREVYDALYDGGVRSLDRWVGKLLSGLRERGLYESSLIAFTSDHGEELGQRGGRAYNLHGHTLYDELVKVPLILKLPYGTGAGTRVERTTRTIDVAPTILDAVGIGGGPDTWEGQSLRPLWEGGRWPHSVARIEALSGYEEKKALRSATHKLIVSIPTEAVEELGRGALPDNFSKVELFDLSGDPLETRNIAWLPSERAGAHLREELMKRLRAERWSGLEVSRAKADPGLVDRLKALGYIE